jgi:hypothetical protein
MAGCAVAAWAPADGVWVVPPLAARWDVGVDRHPESVRVDAESERHRGVTEPMADDLGVDSGLERGRRIAVPNQLQESP